MIWRFWGLAVGAWLAAPVTYWLGLDVGFANGFAVGTTFAAVMASLWQSS